jgi:hypothetical protein
LKTRNIQIYEFLCGIGNQAALIKLGGVPWLPGEFKKKPSADSDALARLGRSL